MQQTRYFKKTILVLFAAELGCGASDPGMSWEVDAPEEISFECTNPPTGLLGVAYDHTFVVSGGLPPFEWEATGLPLGLTLDQQTGQFHGTPESSGDYPIVIKVRDAGSTPQETSRECELHAREPIHFDLDTALERYGQPCVPAHDSALELLLGGDGSPVSCAAENGPGMGLFDHDRHPATPASSPPGLELDAETCEYSGDIDPMLPFGAYAWLVTVRQGPTHTLVPFCAVQDVPADYTITRVEGQDEKDATLAIASAVMPSSGLQYPTDQLEIRVESPAGCPGGNTAYTYAYTFSTLHDDSFALTASETYPSPGCLGLSHGLSIAVNDKYTLDKFAYRPWVMNLRMDYCTATDGTTCGNGLPEDDRLPLILQTGESYMFSLVVFPER